MFDHFLQIKSFAIKNSGNIKIVMFKLLKVSMLGDIQCVLSLEGNL